MTKIIITHNLSSIKNYDKLFIIEENRIIQKQIRTIFYIILFYSGLSKLK